MREKEKRRALLPSEQSVLLAVRDYLAARGFKVYPQRAGRVKSERGGWIQMAPKGASDLTGWHKGTGRAIQVEIKRPGEKPTQEQEQWISDAHFDGAIAFWADSVEMAERELDRYGVSP